MAQTVLILDFGGQYKELIARRVRECSVYSIVKAGDLTAEQVQELNPIGIILTVPLVVLLSAEIMGPKKKA